MNERIEEIAKQSGLWFVTPREDLMDDFAELIAAEVISRAEDYGLGCDAVEQLKQHFGVEE